MKTLPSFIRTWSLFGCAAAIAGQPAAARTMIRIILAVLIADS